MKAQKYEIFIIGAGPAGSTAAKIAVRNGLTVGMAEMDRLGGTCLNYGCDPVRALQRVSTAFHQTKRARPIGIEAPLVNLDWDMVLAHVHEVIEELRGGTHDEAIAAQEARGIDVFMGKAAFESPHRLRVGERVVEAENILIATGYETLPPPVEGLSSAGFLTHKDVLRVVPFPKSMIIIGGSLQGVQFAQIFCRLGCAVTILEPGVRILPDEDEELVELLQKSLEDEGVKCEAGVTLRWARKDGNRKRVSWQRQGEPPHELAAEVLLVATERTVRSGGLNLAAAGLQLRDNHSLDLDANLRTPVPHIWGAGDLTGRCACSNVAAAEGKHVIAAILSGAPTPFDYSSIPVSVATSPAIARVGPTASVLNERGVAFETLELDMKEVTQAVLTGAKKGKIKLLCAPEGDLLAAHLLAENAEELIAPLVVAMKAKVNVDDLAKMLFPYPSLSEGIAITAGLRSK